MPEATVLYSVTAVVIAGLVVWVAAMLKTAKEPWARPRAIPLHAEPAEGELATATSSDEPAARTLSADEESGAKDSAEKLAAEATNQRSSGLDADDTARATPMALSEGRAKAAAPKTEESESAASESSDEKKAEA